MKDLVDIRSQLGLGDAFASYKFEADRVDMHGWNSRHQFFEAAFEAVKPALVIELGVWKGASCIHMANLADKADLPTQIIAIDTWLGSSAHLSNKSRRQELLPVDGFPTIYRTFLANVYQSDQQDRIIPLPMDGISAAFALQRLGVLADIIHIDASHEYEACLTDLRAYWPLLSEKGVMILDDYGSWPSVTRAACQFAAEVDCPLFGGWNKALLPKHPTLGFNLRVTEQTERKAGRGGES